MIEITCHCLLQGSKFSPTLTERLHGIKLEGKNEIGDIGKIGKYKNKPIPYGSGVFVISNNLLDPSYDHYKKIDLLEKLIPKLKSYGVEFMDVLITVAYYNQCNFELSSLLLRRLAALKIPISFSCYEKDSSTLSEN